MTDIHHALDVPARPVKIGGELLYALPLPVLDARTAAARAHADWLESFPSDEDVEVLARRYAFSFTLNNRGHAQEWEHLHGWQRTQFKENARADLQAIADTRRTEEE